MSYFEVSLYKTFVGDITVEAESEEEARRIACFISDNEYQNVSFRYCDDSRRAEIPAAVVA